MPWLYAMQHARKAKELSTMAMLIASDEGKKGRTAAEGLAIVINRGIAISCDEKTSNAQFHGQRSVVAIGRHFGRNESAAANTKTLKRTPKNCCRLGASKIVMAVMKKIVHAASLNCFSKANGRCLLLLTTI